MTKHHAHRALLHSDGGDLANHISWLDGSPHGFALFAIAALLHLLPHHS